MNLARRAKGLTLDEAVMRSKETIMKLEDAVDAGTLLIDLWAAKKTDILQLPSLAVWANAPGIPFLGGDDAAKAATSEANDAVETEKATG